MIMSPTADTRTLPCPLCDGQQFKILHKVTGTFGSFNSRNATFVLCVDCSLVLNVRTDVEAITEEYRSGAYWQNAPPATEKQLLAPSLGSNARMSQLLRMVGSPVAEGSVIIDVGCGAGANVASLSGLLPHCSIVGLEPDEGLVTAMVQQGMPDNVSVRAGFAESLTPDNIGPVRGILMLTVLEHIGNPLAVLTHCRNLLEPDGFIAVSVPDVMRSGPLGLNYFFRDFHLVYYSELTLRHMLQRAGFEVVATSTGGIFDSASCAMIMVVAKRATTATPVPLHSTKGYFEKVRQSIREDGQRTALAGPLRYFMRFHVKRRLAHLAARLAPRASRS